MGDTSRIPLFDGEKQQKTSVLALREPNPILQAVDFIGSDAKFRCAVEQRNFFGLAAELNGLSAEFVMTISST